MLDKKKKNKKKKSSKSSVRESLPFDLPKSNSLLSSERNESVYSSSSFESSIAPSMSPYIPSFSLDSKITTTSSSVPFSLGPTTTTTTTSSSIPFSSSSSPKQFGLFNKAPPPSPQRKLSNNASPLPSSPKRFSLQNKRMQTQEEKKQELRHDDLDDLLISEMSEQVISRSKNTMQIMHDDLDDLCVMDNLSERSGRRNENSSRSRKINKEKDSLKAEKSIPESDDLDSLMKSVDELNEIISSRNVIRKSKSMIRSEQKEIKVKESTISFEKEEEVEIDPVTGNKKAISEKPIIVALSMLEGMLWEMESNILALVGITKLKCIQFLKYRFGPNYKNEKLKSTLEQLLITSLVICWVQSHYTEDDWMILERIGNYSNEWFNKIEEIVSYLSLIKEDFNQFSFLFNLDDLWIPDAKQLLYLHSNTLPKI
eukprot:TRINITY_DN7588_c0_g1_i1.p1 TRINITY_DN7588_c0_g1~~TRINITY_DN7588_c0_g1_i1.p1  ORF type:complete len:427 (+),score=127.74 TRINITY_DN7588_c0_g1_i1:77-1357(+)